MQSTAKDWTGVTSNNAFTRRVEYARGRQCPRERQVLVNVTKPSLPPFEKYERYLRKIWSTRWLTNNGEFVQQLEKRMADYLQTEHLLAVSNGTSALQLVLKALDLKGEVITTPFTFVATTNVVLWESLTPVFADIDPTTFNIDPGEVEDKITRKTSAILAVHVYGNPCYVEELEEIASEYGLKLIFDAAHAFGVQYENQSVLNFGDVSTLSFHATKIFHTIEGGAIVTKEEQLCRKLKLLRNHGIGFEEELVTPGLNAKMNEFSAAMGLCNLQEIDERIQKRKTIYDFYKKRLHYNNVRFQELIASKYNYSYMPVCFGDAVTRNNVYAELLKNGIRARKYFYPLTSASQYFMNNHVNSVEEHGLENASFVADRVLCLPLYDDLELSVADSIVDIIDGALGNGADTWEDIQLPRAWPSIPQTRSARSRKRLVVSSALP